MSRGDRSPGPMPTLSKKLTARRFLFFDTETSTRHENAYKKRLNFVLGYAVYVEYDYDYNVKTTREVEIPSQDAFIEVLTECANGSGLLYAVAHNLAFDLQILNLPALLSAAGWQCDLPILSWGASLWSVRKEKLHVHFMDSANLFPGKLETLGKEIGHPKLKIDPLTAKHNDLREYCRNDCHILRVAFTRYLQFLNDNELGYFGETLSWQAMNAYRSKFYQGNIITHCDYVLLDYERKAYIGARTEAFFVGTAPEEDYFLVDVNSMYPHVMKQHLYPVEFDHLEVRPNLARIEELLTKFYLIAKVEVNTDEAVFPFRTDSKLVFPVGRYNTMLHDTEIRYSVEHGSLARCDFVLAYLRDELFTQYVDFFAGVKDRAIEDSNPLYERLAKQFGRALYGKFGQRNYYVKCQGDSDDPGIQYYPVWFEGSDRRYDEWHFYGKVYLSAQVGEKSHSNPAIAGAVTAYARMELWKLINEAGSHNVFYVDTDSMVVNQLGLDRIRGRLHPSSLGSLKLVSQSRKLTIHAPKDYSLGELSKRKGVASKLREGSRQVDENSQFRGLKRAMKENDASSVVVTNVQKRRISTYDKGRIMDDHRVAPWRLPEDANQAVFQPSRRSISKLPF